MTVRVPLANGGATLVDAADLPLLEAWYLRRAPGGHALAIRWDKATRRQVTRMLHRILLDAPDGMFVDHINGDRLDNRRSNLRLCDRLQNMRNIRVVRAASGYKGVVRYKRKWKAQIGVSGEVRYLGLFDSPEEAARAYDAAATEAGGEFAATNRSLGRLR